MNIFEKAFAGLNLTPGQRATLKLLQSFANAGLLAVLLAAPAILSAKAGDTGITLTAVGIVAGAFVHGFMMAWQKYVSAKGDAPLAAAIGSIDSSLAAHFPPDVANAPKVEPLVTSSAE